MNEETIKHIKKLRDCDVKWKNIENLVGYDMNYCVKQFYNKYPDLKRKQLGNKLTASELVVFYKIVKNGLFKHSQIANELCISIGTTKSHINNIYDKLNLHSVAELIWAYYNGKIERELINET